MSFSDGVVFTWESKGYDQLRRQMEEALRLKNELASGGGLGSPAGGVAGQAASPAGGIGSSVASSAATGRLSTGAAASSLGSVQSDLNRYAEALVAGMQKAVESAVKQAIQRGATGLGGSAASGGVLSSGTSGFGGAGFTRQTIPLNQLTVNPAETQFRVEARRTRTGETDRLRGVEQLDESRLGQFAVFPTPGGTPGQPGGYTVIDAHHRFGLLQRLASSGQIPEDYPVPVENFGDVQDYRTARFVGARRNISQGTAAARDIAAYVRESGHDVLNDPTFGPNIPNLRQGASLARLAEPIYNAYQAQGTGALSESRALALSGLPDQAAQLSVYEKVRDYEASGNRRVSDDAFSRYVASAGLAPTAAATPTGMASLFGDEVPADVNLGIQRAEVASGVLSELRGGGRLANQLAQGRGKGAKFLTIGGVEFSEENAAQFGQLAGEGGRLTGLVEQLAGVGGSPVDKLLNQGASALAGGSKLNDVVTGIVKEVLGRSGEIAASAKQAFTGGGSENFNLTGLPDVPPMLPGVAAAAGGSGGGRRPPAPPAGPPVDPNESWGVRPPDRTPEDIAADERAAAARARQLGAGDAPSERAAAAAAPAPVRVTERVADRATGADPRFAKSRQQTDIEGAADIEALSARNAPLEAEAVAMGFKNQYDLARARDAGQEADPDAYYAAEFDRNRAALAARNEESGGTGVRRQATDTPEDYQRLVDRGIAIKNGESDDDRRLRRGLAIARARIDPEAPAEDKELIASYPDIATTQVRDAARLAQRNLDGPSLNLLQNYLRDAPRLDPFGRNSINQQRERQELLDAQRGQRSAESAFQQEEARFESIRRATEVARGQRDGRSPRANSRILQEGLRSATVMGFDRASTIEGQRTLGLIPADSERTITEELEEALNRPADERRRSAEGRRANQLTERGRRRGEALRNRYQTRQAVADQQISQLDADDQNPFARMDALTQAQAGFRQQFRSLPAGPERDQAAAGLAAATAERAALNDQVKRQQGLTQGPLADRYGRAAFPLSIAALTLQFGTQPLQLLNQAAQEANTQFNEADPRRTAINTQRQGLLRSLGRQAEQAQQPLDEFGNRVLAGIERVGGGAAVAAVSTTAVVAGGALNLASVIAPLVQIMGAVNPAVIANTAATIANTTALSAARVGGGGGGATPTPGGGGGGGGGPSGGPSGGGTPAGGGGGGTPAPGGGRPTITRAGVGRAVGVAALVTAGVGYISGAIQNAAEGDAAYDQQIAQVGSIVDDTISRGARRARGGAAAPVLGPEEPADWMTEQRKYRRQLTEGASPAPDDAAPSGPRFDLARAIRPPDLEDITGSLGKVITGVFASALAPIPPTEQDRTTSARSAAARAIPGYAGFTAANAASRAFQAADPEGFEAEQGQLRERQGMVGIRQQVRSIRQDAANDEIARGRFYEGQQRQRNRFDLDAARSQENIDISAGRSELAVQTGRIRAGEDIRTRERDQREDIGINYDRSVREIGIGAQSQRAAVGRNLGRSIRDINIGEGENAEDINRNYRRGIRDIFLGRIQGIGGALIRAAVGRRDALQDNARTAGRARAAAGRGAGDATTDINIGEGEAVDAAGRQKGDAIDGVNLGTRRANRDADTAAGRQREDNDTAIKNATADLAKSIREGRADINAAQGQEAAEFEKELAARAVIRAEMIKDLQSQADLLKFANQNTEAQTRLTEQWIKNLDAANKAIAKVPEAVDAAIAKALAS